MLALVVVSIALQSHCQWVSPYHAQGYSQPIIQPTTKNKEKNSHKAILAPVLAQARRPHSDEKGSLAQASLFRLDESSNNGTVALSRFLCETSSLERNELSPKTGARRLSNNSHKYLRGFLILSLRRDPLAWARISYFLHYSSRPTQRFIKSNAQYMFISF
ncbi:hypothetical protein DEO72_LG10g2024 [Vigna unguiculata]|uniref:Secreted protein n=1 Tax=Vigna unguiculata TaxID=3917 RepID=A0A4D6ND06_VIGUN|nr:hypothetical protein DEO72_LG10g2024 [Vigna unguiculata]